MKLIIDIYDDAYKYCKSIKDDDLDDLGFFTSHILKSVANGTPFDSVIEDIKAEISEPIQEDCYYVGTAKIQAETIKWCLEIIDKHISGKER